MEIDVTPNFPFKRKVRRFVREKIGSVANHLSILKPEAPSTESDIEKSNTGQTD